MLGSLDNARVAAIERELSVEKNASWRTQQNMLDDLFDAGGGVLNYGLGTWDCGDNDLSINGNCIIRGRAEAGTVINFTGGGVKINTGAGTETLRAGIENITLDGNSATTGAEFGVTLGQTATSPLSGAGFFKCVTFKRFSGAGAQLSFTALATWLKCTFESNADGFQSLLDGTASNLNGATTQQFICCRFYNNTQRGLWVDQAESWSLWACDFEHNGWEGARFEKNANTDSPMRLVQLESCYFEANSVAAANTYPDLHFSNASTFSHLNMAVRRCRFQGTNTAGNIKFNHGSYIEEDNVFVPVSTSNVICINSSTCFVTCRTDRDPSTFYTIGALTPVLVWRMGGSSFQFLINSGGAFITAPTTVANAIATNAGQGFSLTSDVPNSSTAVAQDYDNTTALSTTGALIARWKLAGVTKATLTNGGSFNGGSFYCASTGAFSTLASNAAVAFTGNRFAASNLPAIRCNNLAAITAADGRIMGWYNDATFTTLLAALRRNGELEFKKTDISGSPGAGTASTVAGFFAFAAGTGTGGITITNTIVTTSSVVIATVVTNDATAKKCVCVSGSGSFTAYLDANATGITKVYFEVRQ